MRHLITLLLLLTLGSCAKEEEQGLPVPIYGPCDGGAWAGRETGWMSALKNGQAMEGTAMNARCHLDPDWLTVFFSTCDSLGVLSEQFFLSCLPWELRKHDLCQVGTVECSLYAVSYFTTYDDQTEDLYLLDESKGNYLEITAVDTVEGWVEGRFDLWFVHDKERKPKEYEANPDRVRFSEGRFRALRQ